MKHLLIIGIGAGDPEYLTVQAIRALERLDVLFVFDKGSDKDDLAALRRRLCDEHASPDLRVVAAADPERVLRDGSYDADVRSWHDQRVDLYERLLRDEVADGETAGYLVWGDPALYDSTLRIVDQVVARGTVALTSEVVPGISAVSALCARHAIPLNQVGRPVTITTGRQLVAMDPAAIGDVVVLLDGSCSFTQVDPTGLDLYWGAYLGTPDELLVAGPLAEVADRVVALRAEARARKGWMFDTYLLRRRA